MIISTPRLFDGEAFTGPGAVRIEAGRIAEVLSGTVSADMILEDGFLAPGLIDLHNNGAFGVDCATAGPAEWDHYIKRLAARGVTSVLPTIITAPLEALRAAAARVAAAKARHGAILGLHLEGPFLNAEKRGAHQADWLLTPDSESVDGVLEMTPTMITLAPELPGALAAIRRLTSAGVTVSLGHTNATAAEMRAGADAGARLVTHVFNAQSALAHRAPGAPGVALTDERLFPCLIADGVHVDPLVLQLAFAACPRAVAVTDSILLAGMKAGTEKQFGGAPATLDARGAAIRADGTLAGAAITLDEGVRRLVATGIPVAVALAAATSRPADAISLTDRGRIAPGARADLVWFGNDLSIRQVWTAGLASAPPRRRLGTESARPDLHDLDTWPTLDIVREFLAQETAAQRALSAEAGNLAALADALAKTLAAGGRLFYAGAGTSGRLGLLDAVECGPTFGLPSGVIIPILAGGTAAFIAAAEGAEDDTEAAVAALDAHAFTGRDALVAIAASGSTPFTLAALRHAASLGALTAAITNSPGSPLAAADYPVMIESGPEIIAGSTRLSAGTTQKIALNILSSTVMIRLGKIHGPYMVDLRATNAKLRNRAAAITATLAGTDDAAARLALSACNMHVKTAILMLRSGLSSRDAAHHLETANFSLRRALNTAD